MATKAIDAGSARSEKTGSAKRRIRKVFGNIHEVVQMPNLIEVQRESYEQFLRSDPSIGYVSGLEKTLRSVFPIRDFAGTAELDFFVNYELEPPKFNVQECRQRGITYAAPMRVTLRLIVFEVVSRYGNPLGARYQGAGRLHGRHAADDGERHVLHQRHRARDRQPDAPFAGRPVLRRSRQDPRVGQVPVRRARHPLSLVCWLDFEFDAKDIVNVRIDRKRKLPVTALLFALGLSGEEILNHFYNRVTFVRGEGGWQIPFAPENWRGVKPSFDPSTRRRARWCSPRARRSRPAPPTRRARTA
ncbi:hypothetical protein AB5I41_00025 [Sphingomonas sp. MMS24-JH45]